MTLEYDADKRIKDVTAVLDEYSSWFMQVLRCLSYPADINPRTNFSEPESYTQWIGHVERAGLAGGLVEKLKALKGDLNNEVQTLIRDCAQQKDRPSYKNYDRLVTLFEEFTYHIRRAEIDLLLEDSGIDSLTGLRSLSMLEDDIKREMARLARQGKQFSVALVRIDGLETMKDENSEDVVLGHIKSVADMIRRSVRSFDDAYRLENDEFLLTLKQSTMAGGVKAMERLKRELEEQDLIYKRGEGKVRLSLSSCIAEPLSDDLIEDLLANLRADLDGAEHAGGAVLEYFEMSPLQRFVQQTQD